jgi:hypothetical protein
MNKKKKGEPRNKVLNSAQARGNKLTNFYIDRNILLKIVAQRDYQKKFKYFSWSYHSASKSFPRCLFHTLFRVNLPLRISLPWIQYTWHDMTYDNYVSQMLFSYLLIFKKSDVLTDSNF